MPWSDRSSAWEPSSRQIRALRIPSVPAKPGVDLVAQEFPHAHSVSRSNLAHNGSEALQSLHVVVLRRSLGSMLYEQREVSQRFSQQCRQIVFRHAPTLALSHPDIGTTEHGQRQMRLDE